VERFRARREETKLGAVLCHALYLVNLASRDEEIREKSLAGLTSTMETAQAIGADAVVFHVGSHRGYGFDDAIEIVEPALRELLELTTDDLWLCMENTAGAGGTIGRSVAELGSICEALGGHPRLGVCIDSCHWWASGIDVTNVDALDDAVRDLDTRISLDRLRCLHVNDAAIPRGANRDRHERVGKGVMGNGLATFLSHPDFQKLPAVVETWEDKGPETEDLKELTRLQRLGKRRRRASR
jgi:deoxyribonuclease-4